MRPFRDDGYWLLVPKPWKKRQFVDRVDRIAEARKCRRLEDVVSALKSARKNCRNNIRIDHTDGQSLFMLPKTLSRGVRLWKNYEARFKRWLEANVFEHAPADGISDDIPFRSSFYEEDPLRAYYTIWHCNTAKVPKKKIATSEKFFEYLDSLSKSAVVERCISKPPNGGIIGRIEDPSSLSAKGRDTLQRWSRLASHYDAGLESGEDEDPVEMWNRALENSIIYNNSVNASSDLLASFNEPSSSGIQSGEAEGTPMATSTAVRSKGSRSRRLSSRKKSENSPKVAASHSTSCDDSEKPVEALEPVTSTAIDLVKDQCENRPTPARPDAADGVSELRRRSSRVFALKSMENTPVQRKTSKKSSDKISPLLNTKDADGNSCRTPVAGSEDAQKKDTKRMGSSTVSKSDGKDAASKPSPSSTKNSANRAKSGRSNTPKSSSNESSPVITRSSLRKRKTETPKSENSDLSATPKNPRLKRTNSAKNLNGVTPRTTAKSSTSSSERTQSAERAKNNAKKNIPVVSTAPGTPALQRVILVPRPTSGLFIPLQLGMRFNWKKRSG
ncbi:hypothetical protein ANCCAN_01956 [Ancylostoma caninum]|uniref:Uncharacterized protein n=1 Tax=Ancylostoma caninum TaxID=29170 RepID=A0A368H830_ANCCA|nr:hypothetical protein ANCCAN_01956 [Ancylostoma caninum]